MPDERGTVFEVLAAAARRGIDLRLLVWRPEPEMFGLGKVFPGSAANHAWLTERDSPLRIRWDRAAPGFAQHQKCWLVDAGQPGEIAFVGGINLTQATQNAPGHDGEGQTHDVYVEIQGTAASDVYHTFAQRWNEASERDRADAEWDIGEGDGDLGVLTVRGNRDRHRHLALESGIVGMEGDSLDETVGWIHGQEAGGEAVFAGGGFAGTGIGGRVRKRHLVAAALAEIELVDDAGHLARRLPGFEGARLGEGAVDRLGRGADRGGEGFSCHAATPVVRSEGEDTAP